MVGMIASKKAGRTLLLIVAILLLPVGVLGTLYMRQALKDITLLEREQIGLEITSLVYSALLSPNHAISDADRQAIYDKEMRLGVHSEDAFEVHLKFEQERTGTQFVALPDKTDDHLHSEGNHSHEQDSDHLAVTEQSGLQEHNHGNQTAIAGYLADVGDVSGLILDGESVSYHLASAFLVQLPELVDTHEKMVSQLSSPLAAGNRMRSGVSDAQQALGGLKKNYRSLQTALGNASRSAESSIDFRVLNSTLDQQADTIDATEMVLGRLTFLGTRLSESDQLAIAAGLDQTRSVAQNLSRDGLGILKNRLNERRATLLRELIALGVAGLACSIAAMSLAVLMFKRTLTQLDKVEGMRDAAEFARAETERINGEVANLNSELSDKVQKLADAQNDIVRKGKMEQLGQLTATVAHELRNPLGAVRTSAFLIGKKIDIKSLGIESQMERINTGIVRCDNIITQLLDYSRTKKIEPKPSDLDEWLAGVVGTEAAKLPSSIMIECTLGLDGRQVPFDPARLERAVINLMSNAAEALANQNPPNGSPTLFISTHVRNQFAVIRVKDNGPGIAAENLQKIREPLFTTKNFGTGLGIPAIEQIAEQHHGRLEVESRLGEGACFELLLPLHSMSGTQAA